MRFWDSSALVPLLSEETSTTGTQALYDEDPEVLAWWATETECVSAIARNERAGVAAGLVSDALARLAALVGRWQEVEPVETVRATARRLVRAYDLRAADALQLAAALAACEGRPESLELVTLDERLASAARREGFPVSPTSGKPPPGPSPRTPAGRRSTRRGSR